MYQLPLNFQSDLAEFSELAKLCLSFIMASHILLKKQEPVVCLSWLLGVATFPILTAICYLGFGMNPFEQYAARKRASKHLAGLRRVRRSREEIIAKNETSLASLGFSGFDRTALWASMLQGSAIQYGNQAEILVNSTNAFSAAKTAIEGAREFILAQFYQIQVDPVGIQFLDLLAAKAQAGVKVYVLFDALGSHRLKTSLMNEYRKKGLKIYRFLEVHPIKRRFQINWRNHRKLIVVDGKTAFTGGFNVGEMYLEGPDPSSPKWFDLIFRVRGPVIGDLTALFAEDWHFTTGKTLPNEIIERYQHNATPIEGSKNLLQVISSGPSENNAPFYSTFINILHESRKRVWIMTPYFVPDKELLHAMRMAVVRGVHVRVIVPKHSNHPITDTCAHSYFSEFDRYGIDLLRYVPGVCHGKLLLADDDLILAGSSNLDYRSFFLNFETDLLMRDRELAGQVAAVLNDVAKQCIPLGSSDVSGRRLARLLFRRIMRLFAPLM
jgi:cardiolipin synthase